PPVPRVLPRAVGRLELVEIDVVVRRGAAVVDAGPRTLVALDESGARQLLPRVATDVAADVLERRLLQIGRTRVGDVVGLALEPAGHLAQDQALERVRRGLRARRGGRRRARRRRGGR